MCIKQKRKRLFRECWKWQDCSSTLSRSVHIELSYPKVPSLSPSNSTSKSHGISRRLLPGLLGNPCVSKHIQMSDTSLAVHSTSYRSHAGQEAIDVSKCGAKFKGKAHGKALNSRILTSDLTEPGTRKVQRSHSKCSWAWLLP